jgi:hypothetical protein
MGLRDGRAVWRILDRESGDLEFRETEQRRDQDQEVEVWLLPWLGGVAGGTLVSL